MTSYLHLFLTFFRIGLFTIGGGLAAIPLLQNYALMFGWVDEKTFADMIAISESTPGPIGINMATYVGFSQLGFAGSVVATAGIVMPSLVIIYAIAKFLGGFNDHWLVKAVLQGIRPTVIGIIASTLISIGKVSLFIDIKSILLFLLFTLAVMKIKLHPIFFIVGSGIIGLILF